MKITFTSIAISFALALIQPVCLRGAGDGDTVTLSRSELQKLIQAEVQKALGKEKQRFATTQNQKASGATPSSLAPASSKVSTAAPASPATSAAGTPLSASDTLHTANSLGFFSVPNSSAASALNMNPDTMPRATLPKQLGLSNLNGIDLRGNPQTGLALDFAAGQLFLLKEKSDSNPNPMTAKDYADSYLMRLAMRTQFSFAETRGTSSDDKSLKIAAGVMIPLLVAHDAVQNAGNVGKTVVVDTRSLNALSDLEYEPRFSTPIFGKLENTLWKHSDLAVGGYALGASQDGSGTDFKYGGSAVYGTWDFSYDKKWPVQFVTNVTYRDHQQVPASSVSLSGSSALVPEDSLLLGAGIQFGNKTINATAFYAWIKEWENNQKDEHSNRYGVLAEYHLPNSFLGPNAFITLSAGEEIGGGDRPSNSFVLGGVKIGLGGSDFGNLVNGN